MALGDHGDVGNRQLQGPGTLLLRDQAGNTAIHLAGEKPLRAYGYQPKHPLQAALYRDIRREFEWCGHQRAALQFEHLLWHIAKHLVKRHIHGRGSVP